MEKRRAYVHDDNVLRHAYGRLFLMLLGGVGFVQDRRFFTSAPKDVQAVLQDKEERFPGQHIIGWCLIVVSVLMMAGSMVYGGWDGIRNDYGFIPFFIRFSPCCCCLKRLMSVSLTGYCFAMLGSISSLVLSGNKRSPRTAFIRL